MIGLTLLLALPAIARAQERENTTPVVLVKGHVDSRDVRIALGRKVVEVEHSIGTSFISQACKYLRFIHWTFSEDVGHSYTIRVALGQNRRDNLRELVLTFDLISGRDRSQNPFMAGHPVIPTSKPHRTNDPENMKGQIESSMKLNFADPSFLSSLVKETIGRIPIAREVVYKEPEPRLYLPIRPSQLTTRDGSKLKAELKSKFRLSHYGFSQLILEKYSQSSILDTPTMVEKGNLAHLGEKIAGWHSDIPAVLAESDSESVFVWLEDYFYQEYSRAREELIIDLEEGPCPLPN